MGFVHEKAKMTLGNKTAWRFSLIPCSSRWEIVFKSGDNVIFRGFRGKSGNNISVGTQSTDYLNRNMKLIHISVSLCEIDGQRWHRADWRSRGFQYFTSKQCGRCDFLLLFFDYFCCRYEAFFFFSFQLCLDFIIAFVIVFHELERQLHYSSKQCLTLSSCSLLLCLQLTIS